MEDVVEVALITQGSLGEAQSQASLLGIYIALLTFHDGLCTVCPEDDRSRIVEDNSGDLEAPRISHNRVVRLHGRGNVSSRVLGVGGQSLCTIHTVQAVLSMLPDLIIVDDQSLESGHWAVEPVVFGLDLGDLYGYSSIAQMQRSDIAIHGQSHQIIVVFHKFTLSNIC